MYTTKYIRKDPHIKWILQYQTVDEAWIHADLDQKLEILRRAPELFNGIRGNSQHHNILDVVKDRIAAKDLSGISLK